MDTEQLRAKIADIPYWYHHIELPGGIVTPGWAPLDIDKYRVPKSLIGHRVLDVGSWDGFWAFEALRRGAIEVVAIDNFSDSIGPVPRLTRPKWESFDLCKEALGWTDAEVTRQEMAVYDVSPEKLGMFDTVFMFGVIYHLKHPLLGLEKLASVCRGNIYIESLICDDMSPYRDGMGEGHRENMVMEFYPDDQLGRNHTNWWVPTLTCLTHMVRVEGFKDVKGTKFIIDPKTPIHARGFVTGTRDIPSSAS